MKAILLGMNNPYGGDPRYALYPHPPRCTGQRIYEMLRTVRDDVTTLNYIEGFDRRNLVVGEWSMKVARACARKFLDDVDGRSVLVFGAQTWAALGIDADRPAPGKFVTTLYGAVLYWLPHPSGRCLWYNDQRNRAVAATLLRDLYEEGAD
jgi:hypothetical protein